MIPSFCLYYLLSPWAPKRVNLYKEVEMIASKIAFAVFLVLFLSANAGESNIQLTH